MTNERAIEVLTNAIQTEHMTAEQDGALAIAQKALKKQIPKKPTNKSVEYNGTYGFCPSCNECVIRLKDWWCPSCGQALDWS